MTIEHCPTEKMIGDYMTKALQGKPFREFTKRIMNIDNDTPIDDLSYHRSVLEEKTDGKRE